MDVAVGFDPGGRAKFGWAIIEIGHDPPFGVLASGRASHAHEALTAVLAAAEATRVIGVGIDAPMFWTPTGARASDAFLRGLIGPPTATVQEPNSLRGACVVQGPIIANLCRRSALSTVPLFEAHPKAFLRLVTKEGQQLTDWVVQAPSDEDERDAVLGALAAWAGVAHPHGWENLRLLERSPLIDPFPGPHADYYLPTHGRVASARRHP